MNSRGKFLSHEALLCRTAEIIFIHNERRGEVQPPVLFLLKVPTSLSCFCGGFSDNAAAETRDKESFSYLIVTQLAIQVSKWSLGVF